jgi:hypothetical protein
MASKISRCRICNNTNLLPIINLGNQFLTGHFAQEPHDPSIASGPLSLVKCFGPSDTACGLLQLEHSYDLGTLYGDNYGYRSGLNKSMVEHLRSKVAKILSTYKPNPAAFVLDIGSNDGTTLSAYPKDFQLIGMDPTAKKFLQYYPPHIKVISDFFSSKSFLGETNSKADIITSFSMFYDLESPIDFAQQIADSLNLEGGVWIFEQSYMPTMLKQVAYDTICHEHLEYYSLRQIDWILESVGLQAIDIELNDINGGSFSVVAAHKNSKYPVSEAVINLRKYEQSLHLDQLNIYMDFVKATEDSQKNLLSVISKINREYGKINALGASTKGNVILQYCGLTADQIEAVGEVNSDKFNCFTPGSWIPIRPESEVLQHENPYLLILPWHFRDFFVSNAHIKNKKLLFPLPKIDIVEK